MLFIYIVRAGNFCKYTAIQLSVKINNAKICHDLEETFPMIFFEFPLKTKCLDLLINTNAMLCIVIYVLQAL